MGHKYTKSYLFFSFIPFLSPFPFIFLALLVPLCSLFQLPKTKIKHTHNIFSFSLVSLSLHSYGKGKREKENPSYIFLFFHFRISSSKKRQEIIINLFFFFLSFFPLIPFSNFCEGVCAVERKRQLKNSKSLECEVLDCVIASLRSY